MCMVNYSLREFYYILWIFCLKTPVFKHSNNIVTFSHFKITYESVGLGLWSYGRHAYFPLSMCALTHAELCVYAQTWNLLLQNVNITHKQTTQLHWCLQLEVSTLWSLVFTPVRGYYVTSVNWRQVHKVSHGGVANVSWPAVSYNSAGEVLLLFSICSSFSNV